MVMDMMLKYNLQFFAKDGPGGEKTEQPTSKKLEDARKEGQVAKSKEIANAFGILSLFLVVKIYVGKLGIGMMEYFSGVYNRIPELTKMYDGRVSVAPIHAVLRGMILQLIIFIAPVLLVGVLVAVVCDILQVKWKPTTKPLKPKFNKLNPIKGFGRIFSKNSLIEL